MSSMTKKAMPKIPITQLIFGEIMHWLTVLACVIAMIAPVVALLNMKNNVLNPHFLFAAIWDGKGPDAIWQEVGSGFPGGHFYLQALTAGDGLAMWGVAIGCSAALWALLPTVVQYIRERQYFYAVVCFLTAALIAVSIIGLVKTD